MRTRIAIAVLIAAAVLGIGLVAAADGDCTSSRCVYVSPVLTAPPTPTPIGPPTGVCATNAPLPAEGAVAWMVDPQPSRYSNATLCTRLIVGGRVVSNASVYGVAHYRTTDTNLGPAATDSEGVAVITFYISGATRGYTVRVDVTAVSGGAVYHTQTSFTPF